MPMESASPEIMCPVRKMAHESYLTAGNSIPLLPFSLCPENMKKTV